MKRSTIRFIDLFLLAFFCFITALFLADYVANSIAAQELVQEFGYVGIVFISTVMGLSVFVPLSGANFTPVYLAAGFSMFTIIPLLVLGTMIADAIGYLIGRSGKRLTEEHYPELQKRIERFARRHHRLVIPTVFLYAALSPLPNELVVIPLALVGFKFRTIIIPLLLGTTIYQTLIAYGTTSIFQYFF